MKASLDLRTSPVSLDSEPDPGSAAELKARVDAFLAAADVEVSRSLSPNSIEFLKQHRQSPGE